MVFWRMKVSAASLAGNLYIGDCPLPQRLWNPGRSLPQRSHGAMSGCSSPQRSQDPRGHMEPWRAARHPRGHVTSGVVFCGVGFCLRPLGHHDLFAYDLWGTMTSGVGLWGRSLPKKAALSGGTFQAASSNMMR